VLTVSVAEFHKTPAEVLRHVRGGGLVRIIDLHRKVVVCWLTPDTPASMLAMPDDLPALCEARHEAASQRAREREARTGQLRGTRWAHREEQARNAG
jgi:hypothetical protein